MVPFQLPILQPKKYTGGTTADRQPAARVPGRFVVVEAEGRYALYVPEVQQLFRLPGDMAAALHRALQDLESPEYAEARQFVIELVRPYRREPLQNRDRNNSLRDLVVHPSQICNLDCKYCYAHEINQVNR